MNVKTLYTFGNCHLPLWKQFKADEEVQTIIANCFEAHETSKQLSLITGMV